MCVLHQCHHGSLKQIARVGLEDLNQTQWIKTQDKTNQRVASACVAFGEEVDKI